MVIKKWSLLNLKECLVCNVIGVKDESKDEHKMPQCYTTIVARTFDVIII